MCIHCHPIPAQIFAETPDTHRVVPLACLLVVGPEGCMQAALGLQLSCQRPVLGCKWHLGPFISFLPHDALPRLPQQLDLVRDQLAHVPAHFRTSRADGGYRHAGMPIASCCPCRASSGSDIDESNAALREQKKAGFTCVGQHAGQLPCRCCLTTVMYPA